jgi:hypothetical protein
LLALKKTEWRRYEQKEKSISVAAPYPQLSCRIMGRNEMSHASPHESSAIGCDRESFVQVLANI